MVRKVLFGFLVLQCALKTESYPTHASCNITWTIPMSCKRLETALIRQMEEWKGDENCGQVTDECPKLPCGQLCLYYNLGTDDNGILRGMHQTPVHRYNDSISFEFMGPKQGSDCVVQGFSSSDLWYAYLDFGTNYCNIRNLMDGIGASELNGFAEESNTDVCTQYDALNCARY